ncbi:MAG TPA: NAD(P)H-dependent oxidoreductase [Nocardioides sp.]|nr:NAD(P)H-dependent oxidoreductase [Nocardioides sp.]
MPTRLLHIVATPRGLASNTGRVSSVLIEELHHQHDDLEVTTLDLFHADLPSVAGVNIKSKYALMTGQPLDEEARSSWNEIERTIQGFLAADIIVVTAPMWNFGIPYALKYYIDAIVQPGYLFTYDEQGAVVPLVHGKRMAVVTSRGGDYSAPPMDAMDHMVGYLRAIFGFVGITELRFFNVQPCDITPELRNAAAKQAIAEVRSWVGAGAWDAERAVVPA